MGLYRGATVTDAAGNISPESNAEAFNVNNSNIVDGLSPWAIFHLTRMIKTPMVIR